MKSKKIQSYFDLIEIQRDVFYQDIMNEIKDPWKRPQADKWSVGETIYHLMLLARLVRKFSSIYLPVMMPYGHLRKKRLYKTEIHNIYEAYNHVKKRPMRAPFLLVPPGILSQKYNFADVQELLRTETAQLKIKLSGIDEHVAGQIKYPDPIAHYPNIIQSVHLLAIHEQHHFTLVKKYAHM